MCLVCLGSGVATMLCYKIGFQFLCDLEWFLQILSISVFHCQVVASVVRVEGANMTFMGNSVEGLNGGAIYLTSYSLMILSEGSTFNFIDNTGRYVCVL